MTWMDPSRVRVQFHPQPRLEHTRLLIFSTSEWTSEPIEEAKKQSLIYERGERHVLTSPRNKAERTTEKKGSLALIV